ncbi:PPE family protein [Mycobacterium haemophilum]
MLNFSALPPEVNAAKLRTGPGNTSMLAAGKAWEQLSDALDEALVDIDSVGRTLTGVWQGAVAMKMTQAVAAYCAWLWRISEHAGVIARETHRVAWLYWAAHMGMVPPSVIAETITQRETLIRNNLLGQNTGAIATAEAKYQQYWRVNADEMNSYARDAWAAMSLMTPFAEAPEITNETVLAQADIES